MCFKPVNLGKSYPTIGKTNVSNSFQLSPTPSSVSFAQKTTNSNTRSRGYSFNFSNSSQNLKVHRVSSHEINRAIKNAAPAATLPIKAVCKALRSGRVPVKRPFTKPKMNNATSVKATENISAVGTLMFFR
jgi:hypothetical protein